MALTTSTSSTTQSGFVRSVESSASPLEAGLGARCLVFATFALMQKAELCHEKEQRFLGALLVDNCQHTYLEHDLPGAITTWIVNRVFAGA